MWSSARVPHCALTMRPSAMNAGMESTLTAGRCSLKRANNPRHAPLATSSFDHLQKRSPTPPGLPPPMLSPHHITSGFYFLLSCSCSCSCVCARVCLCGCGCVAPSSTSLSLSRYALLLPSLHVAPLHTCEVCNVCRGTETPSSAM